MEQIKKYLEKYNNFLATYEELSKTDKELNSTGNIEPLTSSKDMAYGFDKIVNKKFCSADALLIRENDIVFIEFKNCKTKYGKGTVDELKTKNLEYNVRLKAVESIIALAKLLVEGKIINEMKDIYAFTMKYIVVYSAKKNETLYHNEFNMEMRHRYQSKAIFNLERYRGILFREILTISNIKFDKIIADKLLKL